MSGLFPPLHFSDFGHSIYLSYPEPLHRVDATKTNRLRRLIKMESPKCPGVYGFLDRQEHLIYVGKAKNLRTRLMSYFRPKGRPPKAGRMIAQTTSIVWQHCPDEFASLLRELELIRRWRPRWNVQGQPLRRRHTFVCVGRAPAPYAFLSPKPTARCLAIFGPIPAGRRAGEAVRRLNDAFRLRDCPQKQTMRFPDQGELFPELHPAGCLRLEIATCLGPCTGGCTRADYHAEVSRLRHFLMGNDASVLAKLEAEMQQASLAQNYEQAGLLRDRWKPLHWLAQTLQRLRHAQSEMSFVYPLSDASGSLTWYLIHGARPMAVLPEPRDSASRQAASLLLERIYHQPAPLEPYEHADGMMLVMSWFRRHHAERARCLTPELALDRCQETSGRK